MTEEGQDEYTRSGEIKGLGDQAKGVYGFSVKMGLGGKPVIEQFGNIKATDRKYSKEVLLPSPVDGDSIQSSYKNGILEIKLRKKK